MQEIATHETHPDVENLPAEFVRFTVAQRIQHWLLVVTFGGLLLTGLPQKFNGADISVALINGLGGIDNARALHRVLATVFVLESGWHLADIALATARRRFRSSMLFTLQDFRDAFNMLVYSLGARRERPRFDRYDYRQKFEYWGIVFGAIIMIATGTALWFPTYVTRLLPGELVPAAKEMHSGEALLAMLVVVIWHFYDIALSPMVLPLDTAMITGKISREKLLEEHPLEFERMLRQGVVEVDPPAETRSEVELPRQPVPEESGVPGS